MADDALTHWHRTSATSTLHPYRGNCHCGATKFTLSIPELPTCRIYNCNCSLCSAHGLLDVQAPHEAIVFAKGGAELKEYRYCSGSRREGVVFKFCGECGVGVCYEVGEGVHGNREAFVAVNIRTLQGVDLDALEYIRHDGKNYGEPYVVPE